MLDFWHLLCAKYIEGAVDSRTGKVYIGAKQIAGPTGILCVVGVNSVVIEHSFTVGPEGSDWNVNC
jgi:hypothetical protein